MLSHIFCAAGVVKDDGEIKRVGVGDFVKESAVDPVLRFVFGDELVKLLDAAKRVFVGCVTVEKLVLNETIERTEFRQIASEESDAVHQSQNPRDITLAFEDGLEGFAVGFRAAESAVDVIPVLCDEAADLRAEFEVAKLAVLEEPHESMWILAENVTVGGEESAVAGDEAVEFFAAFFAKGKE